MEIDWAEVNKYNLYSDTLYEKIASIPSLTERAKNEQMLYDKARENKVGSVIKELYTTYKKDKELKERMETTIDFGSEAPVQKMIAPGYYKDKSGYIRTLDKNALVTATLLEPIAIFKNVESRR